KALLDGARILRWRMGSKADGDHATVRIVAIGLLATEPNQYIEGWAAKTSTNLVDTNDGKTALIGTLAGKRSHHHAGTARRWRLAFVRTILSQCPPGKRGLRVRD